MTGFKDETQMWEYQRKRLSGRKWQRYELIFPDGHPDVKGSFEGKVIYIENKVSAEATREVLRPSQREYIAWLLDCNQEVWIAYGDPKQKIIRFARAQTPQRLEIPRFWNFRAIRR